MPYAHFDDDESAARELSEKITKVVEQLMTAAGYNITTFAKAIGYTRTRLSQVMNCRGGKNLWRLPQLCAVSRIFQISVSEIIRLAAGESSVSMDTLMQRVSAPPGSPERLRTLIFRMLSLYSVLYAKPEYEPDREGEYESRFRCTPMEIEQGAPSFWQRFASCMESENDTLKRIWKAIEYAEQNGGLSSMPLWVAIKNV